LSDEIDKHGCGHACAERYAHPNRAVFAGIPHKDAVRPGLTGSTTCSVSTSGSAARWEEEGSRHNSYQGGREPSHPNLLSVWRLRLGRGRDEAGSGPLRTTFARHSYSRVRQGDLLAKGGGVNLEPVDRPPRRRSGSTFGENASLLDASGLFPRRLEPATVRRRCGELVGVQALDASLFAAALRDLLQARFSQRSSAAEPQSF
jgi:hypothetical protein